MMFFKSSVSARHILIHGQRVGYELQRSARKTLAIKVAAQGVTVAAPKAVTLAQIEAFLHKNGPWLLETLAKSQAQAAARQLKLEHGATLPILGQPWTLHLSPGGNRAQLAHGQIHLFLKPEADPAPVLTRALQRHALSLFSERLAHYGQHLASLPPLHLSSARTRWGSCSRLSGIRLNWRLIHLPLELIDYVVAHELAHLEEMNHSPRFWAAVERLYPHWRPARQQLKTLGAQVPLFG